MRWRTCPQFIGLVWNLKLNLKLGKNDFVVWGEERGVFEAVPIFFKSVPKYLCFYLIFNKKAIFVSIAVGVITSICLCGHKIRVWTALVSYNQLLSGFIWTMLQNFHAYDLIPVWMFGPAVFSELPIPASLCKGSFDEVLFTLPLDTSRRGWVLAQCPSQEKP